MAKGIAHKRARDRERRKSRKTKQYVIRKSSGDLVAIQIAVKTKKGFPPIKKLNRELIESMIRHKAETSSGQWSGDHCEGCSQGEDPIGIQLAIIRWKNPDRLAEEDSGWRYADPDSPSEQDDAWGTLRRVIQKAPLGVRLDR
jgi:hypothetical protein